MFADHYKRKHTDAMFDRAAKLLGVKYSVEELKELVASLTNPKRKRKGTKGGKAEPSKDVFIPLTLLLNPQSVEILKNVAKGLKLKTSNSTDMSSWDIDSYRDFMDKSIKKAADALLQQEALKEAQSKPSSET